MEFWNHSHFAKTKKNKRNFIAYNNLTYAKRLQKKEPDLCHSCLKKGSLCKLLKHKLVASPHPPQHVSGTGTMSNCQKKKERERDANLCWNPGRSKKKSENSYRHFLVPLQFFGDETGTWRSKLVPKHRVIWSRWWCHVCGELISMARVVGYI